MALGRPKADIDWNQVDKLLQAHCSGAEIAAYFGLNKATLYDRCKTDNNMPFSDYSQQKKAKGNSLLKAKQYSIAMRGDKTMLVWLGKQYLGQKEKHEVDTNINKITIEPKKKITLDD